MNELRGPLIALLLFAQSLCAAATTDPATDAVRKFLSRQATQPGREVRIEVQPAPARLPHCENPRPFLPGKGQQLRGLVTVGVRCGADGRVRYLQAKISIIGDYWVSARRIEAGTRIDADMLRRTRGDLSNLPRGAVLEREQIVGQIASRPLNAGTVLQEQQLKPVPLVLRRQPVTVEARGQGFRIAREGIALEEGALGEKIRVRLADRRQIFAVVSGPGQAQVNF
ncbi:flagella basal body P-ring formation protein FlgA [Microbulbifer thermotolerans]|uniref:flagellar basal body P-ring formation chaperone FlgA n=1 Tax=Microbulbifer thermotolerans TaxID=252514 RepID=UPI0008DFB890|nr:flagellar basal body P-ring formation chaperone FlgA [Microbulbifer thermotolerans]MCX2795887.1 flagellar basal body P-ring formation chaperone FlgA [Microbulbifer thermotolerans]WKT59757.1 flagellar basal body P-ring formation chaperone FlgA [Microbulbifer thermotolerans]SFC61390.1 flagella basal body P-ring formation protein FlgA [Microbulbifer thermotolerans]